ncbi:MAG: twin-arginine translocation signal domain-containing protein [Candidatus Aminicenantes bacterium]|nr:twin-arginine translocation signal domain-containing protein [Candidatus Aminicenantes bacterium]
MNRPKNQNDLPVGCIHHPGFSRRKFLSGCAACAGAAGLAGVPNLTGAPRLPRAMSGAGKTRVRVIYALHGPRQEGADWPNKGFDFVPVMNRINAELLKRVPSLEIIPSLATGEEQTKICLEEDRKMPVDGYLVYQMNCWNQVAQSVVTTGKPVLYADFQFGGSGGFLVYTAGFLRSGLKNFGFVASSKIEDLAEAVKLFAAAKAAGPSFDFAAAAARVRIARTPKAGDLAVTPDPLVCLPVDETVRRLKASRILAVRGAEAQPSTTVLGIPVDYIPFAELNAAWAAANKEEARAIAERWAKSAAHVEGVSRDELVNSAAMYLGQKAVLKARGATGITVNCLGGFYGGHIHAYPCLGFHELLNEGLVGGCECDVPSSAALTAITTMTQGRPGYISDPVIDTSNRTIIYAHCVASNKPFGPKGPANPFEILTHSEDRQGASVRSILPAGYMTTTIDVSQDRKEIILHRAKSVANDPDDRACRTKLVAKPVGDIEKLFTMWDRWGWHRVTAYGDIAEPVRALAGAIGWKVVEET